MENNIQQNKSGEIDIDLLEIIRLIWSKAWLVIIGMIVGAVILFLGTKFLITPQYESTSTIYIFSNTNDSSSLTTDLQLGSQLAEDFEIIATTHNIVEGVINDLDLEYTYDQMVKKITVLNPEKSHILKITVRDESPQMATNISNVLSNKLREQIADVMNTDKPSVVQRAMLPERPSTPNTKRNTAIGGLLGALLVMGIIVLRYMLDDTIKTEEDVSKYLGLNTLAALPYVKGLGNEHPGKNKSGSRRKGSHRGE